MERKGNENLEQVMGGSPGRELAEEPPEVEGCAGHVEEAQQTLEGLVKIPAGALTSAEVESYRGASIQILEGAYQSTGQWSRLAQLWETLLPACEGVVRRTPLYEKLLRVYEGPLADVASAFGVAARAFAESRGESFWQSKLEELAQRDNRVEELACLYLDIADREGSSPFSLALRKRAVDLYEHAMDNCGEAIAQCEQILREGGTDGEVLRSLSRLYGRVGDLLRQEGALHRLLDQTDEPRERQELLVELAECLVSQGEDNRALIPVYQEIVAVAPDHVEALTALEWLLGVERRFGELVPVLEKLLAIPALTDEREDRFLELIRIHEEEGDQKMLALLAACRAFQEGLRDGPIRSRLFRLAREMDLGGQLAEMVDEWLPDIADPVLRAEILRERASLEESQDERAEQSIARWRSVLAASPDDTRALLALRRLYQDGDHPKELADVVARLIQLERDREQKKDLCFELAQLLEEKLGRIHEAIAVYIQILTLDPQDFSALKLLNRLYLCD